MANRPTPGSPAQPGEASETPLSAATNQRPKRVMSEKQLAALKAHQFKAGAPSPNPSGRPNDPRKLAAAALLGILHEVAPGQDRSNIQRMFDKIISNDHLLEVYLHKILPTLTPEQTNNFLTLIGGMGGNGGAPLPALPDALTNRLTRVRALAAAPLVEATPAIVRPSNGNGHTTVAADESEPELEPEE